MNVPLHSLIMQSVYQFNGLHNDKKKKESGKREKDEANLQLCFVFDVTM